MGTVEAGTCGALRMQAIGVVDRREAIVIEHVTRLAPDVAPDWPALPGALGYRDVITDQPDIDCTMAVTAMRVVNAIPYVGAAQPGLVSSIYLALTVPRNAFSQPG